MAKEAPIPEETPPEEAKPKLSAKKRLFIILGGVLVLALGGGAAAMLLLQSPADPDHEAKAEAGAPPHFVNLEPFTVNLQPESGEQFLQVVATLKIKDKEVEERIKTYMPELRHRILLLLSGKKPSEIATPEGREALAEELRGEANRILGGSGGKAIKTAAATKPIGAAGTRIASGPVRSVLFTSFIVQ